METPTWKPRPILSRGWMDGLTDVKPEAVFHTPAAAEATGVRGLPPATFLMGPDDMIVARVRDIDDKVR